MSTARYQRPAAVETYSSFAPQATEAQIAYIRKLTGVYMVGPMTKTQASARIEQLLSRKGR